MGYKEPGTHCGYAGGERIGLARLKLQFKDTAYICQFEKPKTQSTAFSPASTTVLSPYIKFLCRDSSHQVVNCRPHGVCWLCTD
eukprot:659418-Amphidinium_carterae.1